jgi:type IV pilus assembly protein PilZ
MATENSTTEIVLSAASVTARLVELVITMPDKERRALLEELEKAIPGGKRRHPRKDLFTVVDYAVQGRTYKDFVQNIGTGGIFIETRRPLSIGQEIAMTFPLPGAQNHIKIVGEVVRTTDEGIGVKFKLADEQHEATLKSLVESL